MFSKVKCSQAINGRMTCINSFLFLVFFVLLCRGARQQVGEPATTCSCPAPVLPVLPALGQTLLSFLFLSPPQRPRAAPSSAVEQGHTGRLVEGRRRLATGEPHLPPAWPPPCSAHSHLDQVTDQQQRCVQRRFEQRSRRNYTVF